MQTQTETSPAYDWRSDRAATSQEIASDALDGWTEARYGMPLDEHQSEAWQAGWHLWHEHH
jgi:hypothetical protein